MHCAQTGGKSWASYGALPWREGAIPFYTCAALLGDGRLVVAGMTRSPGLPNNTDSQFFVRGKGEGAAAWRPVGPSPSLPSPQHLPGAVGAPEQRRVLASLPVCKAHAACDLKAPRFVRSPCHRPLRGMPMSMDQDGMPKDRMVCYAPLSGI